MSRHGKRLSVFDRLGDFDRSDKHTIHNERLQTDERLRGDKRTSDGLERSHKHHLETSDGSNEGRPVPIKRDKIVLAAQRKESKLEKERQIIDKVNKYSNRSSSSSEGLDESDIDDKEKKKLTHSLSKRSKPSVPGSNERKELEHRHDDQRSKRKRERDSTSDGEGQHKESKRIKTEDSYDKHQKISMDRKDKKDDDSKSKRRSLISESLSEADIEKSDIDWMSLASYPLPKLPFKMSSIQRHYSGPVFTKIGISPSLAGNDLIVKVNESVRNHLIAQYKDTLPHSVFDKPFGESNLACLGVSHLRDSIETSHFFDVGTCRRALTAGTDFNMRQKLRNNQQQQNGMECTSGNGNICFSQFYATSLAIYQN